MTGVSERAADFIIDVAEEVWEDEPTAAELDLTRRILAAANLLAQPTADEAEGDEQVHVVHVTVEPAAEDAVWCEKCEEWVGSGAPESALATPPAPERNGEAS